GAAAIQVDDQIQGRASAMVIAGGRAVAALGAGGLHPGPAAVILAFRQRTRRLRAAVVRLGDLAVAAAAVTTAVAWCGTEVAIAIPVASASSAAVAVGRAIGARARTEVVQGFLNGVVSTGQRQ